MSDNGTPASFLQEDNGNQSCMRLMCCVSLVASIMFGYLALQRQDLSGNGLYITLAFLLGAFAPKALQKALEQKISG